MQRKQSWKKNMKFATNSKMNMFKLWQTGLLGKNMEEITCKYWTVKIQSTFIIKYVMCKAIKSHPSGTSIANATIESSNLCHVSGAVRTKQK